MNKILSVLLTGVFLTVLGSAANAAEPAAKEDAIKAPAASSAPVKQKHAHKAHKSHKVEHAKSAPEAAK